MRIRAVGAVLFLLIGLQFLNSSGPDNGAMTSGSSDETFVKDDARFPEGIPPWCLDQETHAGRETYAVPVHLEINVDDHRSWSTNVFEAWLSRGVIGHTVITDQFKGNYGASVVLTYPDGHRCVDRAQIRIQGDMGYHLRPGLNGIETSLDVRLESGHAAGIIHFKLFLPETRRGDNEVFATSLASEVGLLSPRTFFIEATVNGMEIRYLLQEKFRNEFLEQNQIPESPIFQGDERVGQQWTKHEDSEDVLSHYSLFWMTRLSNPHFAELGPIARAITEEGLSRLNQAYRQAAGGRRAAGGLQATRLGTDSPGIARITGLLSDVDLPVLGESSGSTINEVAKYSALLIATGDDGTGFFHGLMRNNQRFVYDPWLGTVRPIYYDGNISLLDDDPGFFDQIRTQVKDLVNSQEPLTLVAPTVAEAAEALRQDLASIDLQSFSERLNRHGVTIDDQELTELIGTDGVIDDRLRSIALSAGQAPSGHLSANLFSGLHDESIRLVFGSYPIGDFTSCVLGTDICQPLLLSPAEQVSLLRGRLSIDDTDYFFVGNSYSAYQDGRVQPDRLAEGWQHRTLVGPTILSTNQPFDIQIDPSRRILELVGRRPGARAVIWNGTLDGWTVVFEDVGPSSQTDRTGIEPYDHRGLTGCLTFRDIQLSNVSAVSRGGSCEDGIHFLRATGNLALIDVSDTTSDAVDMDFSELSIADLTVTRAGNDCLDVSAGTYMVATAQLNECADKGVSLGESSRSEIGKLSVTGAAVGIASKDSSFAKVSHAVFDDVAVCATVYRKKQAFDGGSLLLEESTCDSNDYREQDGSILRVGQP